MKVVNGAPVYLSDVANVYDGFADQTNIVRIDGRRAVYMAILKKADASTLAVVDAAKEALPGIQAAAPKGLELKFDVDQSDFVRGAIKSVAKEALAASVLVSLMIFVFVGSWRSMILVCTSIPLAILFGIIGMKISGQTLNLMTLGGLSLAIGMLVDDATVEVENINRNQAMGKKLTVAILDGASQIAVPAIVATLSICIVFFPVVLLEGPAKYLFTPLAMAVVYSMLASYLLSRTLVPTLARMLLEHGEPEPETWMGRFNHWREGWFGDLPERLRPGAGSGAASPAVRPATIRRALPGQHEFALRHRPGLLSARGCRDHEAPREGPRRPPPGGDGKARGGGGAGRAGDRAQPGAEHHQQQHRRSRQFQHGLHPH